MEQAIVSDIQRYSIHDGPGIRTTVFLKGCHMRCEWCHNPESQYQKPEIMFFQESCINCGKCIDVCKKGAHYIRDNLHYLDVKKCMDCNDMDLCQQLCCTKSIKISGKSMSVDEVVTEVRRDKDFYETKGGVTFSGGEPLLQWKFIKEVAGICKSEGIGTYVDTTLSVDWNLIEQLVPYVDGFLVDLKEMDTKKHYQHTGQLNNKLLSNLKRMSEKEVKIIIRMPMIAGVNDSENELIRRKEFLSTLNKFERIDIFPVTNHARKKYEALGKKQHKYNENIDFEKYSRFWKEKIIEDKKGE